MALIREPSAGGIGPARVARELDRRGLPTKTGRAGWTHGAVQRILARPDSDAAPAPHRGSGLPPIARPA